MLTTRYILNDDGEPEPCENLLEWCQWMEDHRDRMIVEQTTIGDIWVSTVFLGIDHNFVHSDAPVLWETMIFGGQFADTQWRYSSRIDAQAGHYLACEMVRAAQVN